MAQQRNKKILIIDDDTTAANFAQGLLEKDGYSQIDVWQDGETGWKTMSASQPDIVLLDWRMPTTNGLTLVNRIKKNADLTHIPILIISGQLEKEDFVLVGSMHLVACLKKPPNPVLLRNKVDEMIRQGEWLRRESARMLDEEIPLREKLEFVEKSPLETDLAIAIAKDSRVRGDLETTVKMAELVLSKKPDHLLALAELGKAYLLQGELDKAEEVLVRARGLCPSNLQNLCTLGEVKMNQLATKEAVSAFEEALTVDAQDEDALSGKVLCQNIENYLKSDITEIPDNFASLLNAIGVAEIKKNSYEAGIEHYQSALNYIYADQDKSRVAYNVGLGYEKQGDPSNAEAWYRKSLEFWPDNPKSQKNLNRVTGSNDQDDDPDHISEDKLYS